MRPSLPQSPGHHRGLVWPRDEWSLGPDRAWAPALLGGLFLAALVILAIGVRQEAAGVTAGVEVGNTSPAFRLLPREPISGPEVIAIGQTVRRENVAPERGDDRAKTAGGAGAPEGRDLLSGKDFAELAISLEAGSQAGESGRSAREAFTAGGSPEAAAGGYQGGSASRGLKAIRRTQVRDAALIDEPAKKKPRERRVALPPKASYRPTPKYPQAAELKGIEGVVTLRVLISEKGTVTKHEITGADGGSGDELFAKSVLETLPLWKFQPALDEEGKPIEAWKDYRLVFQMGGSGR